MIKPSQKTICPNKSTEDKRQTGEKEISANTVLYEEKAPISDTLKMALLLTVTAFALLSLYNMLNPSRKDAESNVLLLVTGIIIFTFWTFFNMRFRITTEGVEAWMAPFTYRVKYDDIEYVKIKNIPWYVGWGLRIWGRRIGFISMHKPSVFIKKKSGVFRTFVLSATDHENFQKMIEEQLKD